MFAKSVLALAALSSVVLAAPVEQRGPPKDWAYGYLENYQTYHVRYLALKCYEKHNTHYFQDCCRPMLSTENLHDNRKAYCVPSPEDVSYVTSSLAAKVAGPTPTEAADEASESEYCDTESSAEVAAASDPVVKAAATSSPAAEAPAPKESKAGEQYLAAAQSTTSTSSTPAWTPAPEPSTTPAWTPAPEPTTQAPPPPPPQAPAPAPPSNGGGEVMNGGFATYFFQNGNPGACGNWNNDGAMIVAIDQARWGQSSFGQKSDTCGRWLTITNTNNGKSVSAMVADVCPTCTNGNSLDLSQGAFRAIANDADGMVPISWRWN